MTFDYRVGDAPIVAADGILTIANRVNLGLTRTGSRIH
jgi:hypothetical protein